MRLLLTALLLALFSAYSSSAIAQLSWIDGKGKSAARHKEKSASCAAAYFTAGHRAETKCKHIGGTPVKQGLKQISCGECTHNSRGELRCEAKVSLPCVKAKRREISGHDSRPAATKPLACKAAQEGALRKASKQCRQFPQGIEIETRSECPLTACAPFEAGFLCTAEATVICSHSPIDAYIPRNADNLATQIRKILPCERNVSAKQIGNGHLRVFRIEISGGAKKRILTAQPGPIDLGKLVTDVCNAPPAGTLFYALEDVVREQSQIEREPCHKNPKQEYCKKLPTKSKNPGTGTRF